MTTTLESKLAEIKIITDGGPWATHNMPCPICMKEKAILSLHNGQFQPCWKCQKTGYITLKLPQWLAEWIRLHKNAWRYV